LRTSKTVGATTSAFTYDITGDLSQILNDGTNSYLYGPGGMPVEQIDASNVVAYLHRDQLGSVRVLTDSTKATTGTYTQDAYGKETSHTGSATTPLRYAGQYRDAESGNYWMRARTYDPATGSFLTRDPIESTTGSAYGYAGGSPVNAVDPSGLDKGGNKNVRDTGLQNVSDDDVQRLARDKSLPKSERKRYVTEERHEVCAIVVPVNSAK
jgi:RHS repeat-associated protein